MRLWMTDPKVLCNKHLVSEHYETHTFVGSIIKGRNLEGYLKGGLLETHNLIHRHNELVAEMERRGMNHNSPLSYVELPISGSIDREKSLQELLSRCEQCRRNYNGQA